MRIQNINVWGFYALCSVLLVLGFTLVGAGEEDYDEAKYPVTSPIGQGLMGKKVGDKVEIEVPKGSINFEVLEITYSH